MDTKVMPLSDFQADTEGVLSRCYDSGQPLVVELPNRRLVSIRPVEEDDDLINQLIEHNVAFREMLTKSIASPREPFPFDRPQVAHPERPSHLPKLAGPGPLSLAVRRLGRAWRELGWTRARPCPHNPLAPRG